MYLCSVPLSLRNKDGLNEIECCWWRYSNSPCVQLYAALNDFQSGYSMLSCGLPMAGEPQPVGSGADSWWPFTLFRRNTAQRDPRHFPLILWQAWVNQSQWEYCCSLSALWRELLFCNTRITASQTQTVASRHILSL